jgi:hypothetical protein
MCCFLVCKGNDPNGEWGLQGHTQRGYSHLFGLSVLHGSLSLVLPPALFAPVLNTLPLPSALALMLSPLQCSAQMLLIQGRLILQKDVRCSLQTNGVAQVVEHLPCKSETNPSTTTTTKSFPSIFSSYCYCSCNYIINCCLKTIPYSE